MRPRPPSLLGLLAAEAGYVAALRPSLLPRALAVQVAVCALVMLTGYALGATVQAVAARATAGRWRPPARLVVAGWWTVVALAAVAVAATVPRMADQADQAVAVGAPAQAPAWWAVAVAAVLLAAVGLGLARGVRALAGRVGLLLTTAVLVSGVALGYAGLLAVYQRLDASTAGQTPPTSTSRSGGPGSGVAWDTLGAEGRAFVGGGPSLAQLTAFAGPRAMEPVRVFVGLASASDVTARADLAVAELERTGGLERAVVVVTTTTGNGMVDPVAADSLDYVTGGDVANVAIQYSVLPSWISFLVDQTASQQAGQALFDAVSAAVAARPVGDRPRLLVYGESLGAFGSQAAFAGMTPEQVAGRVDGALWVGPPAASQPWGAWSTGRGGGTAWEPVVGGGTVVRFAATQEAIDPDDPTWGPRRLLFAQNATDPVVWFAAALAWQPPQWLAAPRGPGVPAQVRWLPLVLLEQVLMDLPAAVSAPPGAGHDYARQVPVGWVAVLRPPGWTVADTARLLDAVG